MHRSKPFITCIIGCVLLKGEGSQLYVIDITHMPGGGDNASNLTDSTTEPRHINGHLRSVAQLASRSR